MSLKLAEQHSRQSQMNCGFQRQDIENPSDFQQEEKVRILRVTNSKLKANSF